MPSIIKATDRGTAVQGVPFNFDDVTAKAQQHLNEIRQQAKKIIAAAEQEAVTIREQAQQAGRKAAEQQADKRSGEKVAQQMQTALPAINQALGEIQRAKQAWLREWEGNVIHLAAAIAAKIIRRELQQQPDIPLGLVKEALELAAGNTDVRICLNPADHAALEPQLQALAQAFSRAAPAELIPDASVTPGGCRVDTRYGSIDQQIESQLARIEEELR